MTEQQAENGAGRAAPSVSAEDTAGFDAAAAVQQGSDRSALDETNALLRDEATKSGTNLDTLVGRLVVDQGLATFDEVKHCLSLVGATIDPAAAAQAAAEASGNASGKSLAQLLVEREYVTERQIARLRERIEAERKGKIPGYTDFRKIGAGAMATVFRAKQVNLDRYVAIKVLPKKHSSNPQFIERFFAEGRAAAQLNHPNIVQAFDVGNVGEVYYFVMEFVDGRTVYDDITAKRRYAELDAIETVMQVAEALQHAHERGLIHRDVKPKNIMVTKQGLVKLADMGLARAISDKEAAESEEGKAFGTPYYISPEQIRGERAVGPQSDIYSLGATLYHMVTGTVPFDGKGPREVMAKHLKAPLQPPDHVNPKLSAGVSEIIEMMMAKRPQDRYRGCQDLLVDLRAVKNGEAPPIAHRDEFAAGNLAGLAEAESAAAATELPVDRAVPARSLSDVLTSPVVVLLTVLLVASLTLNAVLALGGTG